MAPFRRLKQNELDRLSDEELIAYLRKADAEGDHAAVREAMGILAFGFEPKIEVWARKAGDAAEDIVLQVLEDALKSAFDGTSVGEFNVWLRTITKRRVADHYRRLERRPDENPLPEEHEGDEDVWGSLGEEDEALEGVVLQPLIDEALESLSEAHRHVIELAGSVDLGFDGLPAKEAAQQFNNQFLGAGDDPMTDGNVHQILSRFRRRLQEAYQAAEGPTGG